MANYGDCASKASSSACIALLLATDLMYKRAGIAMPAAGNTAPTRKGRAPTGRLPDILERSYSSPANRGLSTLAHDCAAWLNARSLPCVAGAEYLEVNGMMRHEIR